MSNELTAEQPSACRRYLVYATVATMPITVNIEKLIGAKSPRYISTFEVMLLILAVMMITDLIKNRPWARFKLPPVPTTLWAALTFFSILWAHSGTSTLPAKEALMPWAQGLINPIIFGVAAVWVFQNISASAAEMRRVVLILGASLGVCVLLALKQYVGPVGVPYDPENATRDLGGVTNVRLAGWYEIRGIFGAQMAMLIPAAAAFAIADKDSVVRLAAGALAVVGLCVTMAAGGFVGACAGIIAVAAAYGLHRRWLTGVTVIAALVALLIIVFPRLPRQNPAVLVRGVALFADDPTDEKETQKPTARLRRMQAELNALVAPVDPYKENSPQRWLKGVGVGNYQNAVNGGYVTPEYPKPMRRTDEEAAYDMEADERFTFGFLETTTIELGIGGLLVVLFMFGSWIFAASGSFAKLSAAENGAEAALLTLASLGAGVGGLVVSVFANPLIRGVGGTFALFFAIALSAQYWARSRQTSD